MAFAIGLQFIILFVRNLVGNAIAIALIGFALVGHPLLIIANSESSYRVQYTQLSSHCSPKSRLERSIQQLSGF